MNWLRTLFEKEAVVASQLATAIIGLLTAFGIINMTGAQTGAVLSLLVASGVVLGRGFAWSKESVDDVAVDAYGLGLARDPDYSGPAPRADDLWDAREQTDHAGTPSHRT